LNFSVGSGKTTVFNTMTGLDVPVGYGGEVRLGTVRVPDERIDRLSAVFRPKKTTWAEMSFCDVPGEHGAKKGLSPKTLQQIRDQEALCLVVRDFESPAVEGRPDPMGELEAFHAECVFADLETVDKRLQRAKKEQASPAEVAAFQVALAALEAERPLRSVPEPEMDRSHFKGFGLLSDRPLLVAVNVGESRAAAPLAPELTKRIGDLDAAGLTLCASVEADISTMGAEEQAEFLKDLGLESSALDRFIRTAYGLLDLISFFTVGEDEVRAWTIRRGTKARRAAGKIHSDLERGFIRAEVIPYVTFLEHGSETAVKSAGKLRVEGQDYVVQDGDLVHVRFNV
jgi:GTP-binding protein YchF